MVTSDEFGIGVLTALTAVYHRPAVDDVLEARTLDEAMDVLDNVPTARRRQIIATLLWVQRHAKCARETV
jgi:hypothetical protein